MKSLRGSWKDTKKRFDEDGKADKVLSMKGVPTGHPSGHFLWFLEASEGVPNTTEVSLAQD